MEMIARFLTGTGKVFVSLFAAVFLYAVGATVFIKSLTQDNDYALRISREARAETMAMSGKINTVEVEVLKSLGDFKSSIAELKTEVRLLKEEIRREK